MKFNILALLIASFYQIDAQPTLSPERWKADLDLLRTELPARHPSLYEHWSKKDFERRLADLSENVGHLTDAQIAIELQAVLAQAGDAHTRIDLMPILQREPVIPIGFGYYAGGIYISGTVKKFEKALGKKVLKVNDLDAEAVLKKAGRYVAQENPYTNRRDALQYLRFPTTFRLAGISADDTLRLLVEDRAGKRETVRVFPLDVTKRTDAMMPASISPESPDLRWQPSGQLFTSQWLPADSTLYVRYDRCLSKEMALAAGDSVSAQRLPPFQPFADSIVALVQRTPGAKLLFDLRFNAGGDASDAASLARRLAAIPGINRKDKLFVGINFYTASAAIQAAALFHELTQATLLGEPTAQRPNHYGEVRSLRLPNSGLNVLYPTKFMRVTKGNPDTLAPDQLLEVRFDDFRQGKDPVLDFVRKQ